MQRLPMLRTGIWNTSLIGNTVEAIEVVDSEKKEGNNDEEQVDPLDEVRKGNEESTKAQH